MMVSELFVSLMGAEDGSGISTVHESFNRVFVTLSAQRLTIFFVGSNIHKVFVISKRGKQRTKTKSLLDSSVLRIFLKSLCSTLIQY